MTTDKDGREWVLVPRELTPEMHSAIRFALENWRGQDAEKTADPKTKHQVRWNAALDVK